jgi:hypothetical protein
MRTLKPAVSLSLAAALMALGTIAALAEGRRAPPGYVVAESWWGHGSITAPVRRGPNGWEVRLPRGTWIRCVRSCVQTLRQQTVDFWESHGTQGKDGGPGYFRLEFYY